MKIQLHKPKGKIETIETDDYTVEQLDKMGLEHIVKNRELKQRWANAQTTDEKLEILAEVNGLV